MTPSVSKRLNKDQYMKSGIKEQEKYKITYQNLPLKQMHICRCIYAYTYEPLQTNPCNFQS
jgi:hypothetical protein